MRMVTMILRLLFISLAVSANASLEPCETVGQLKGDSENCQKFYQCTHNGWAPLICKDGLFFNEDISVCDYPKAGSKCGKEIGKNDNNGQGDENKLDACDDVGKLKGDKENCQKFYQCTHIGWAPLICKEGLFFNEDISVCDWPKAGTKCGKETHTDDYSRDRHESQNDQSKLDACDEVGKLKGDEENCQKFYQCTHKGWVPLSCDFGLYFNEEISVCDWPKAGSKCGKDIHTDDHSGDGQQGQNEEPKFDECEEVGKLKGDEKDCQTFYQCTNNGWAPLKCKDGLFFNEDISVCDWPKEGTKCGKDTHTGDNSGDEHESQNDQSKLDACDEVGKLKGDEENCQKFYQCTHKGWVPLSCDFGLYFNEEISVCDWPKAGSKCGKDIHTDDHSGDGQQGQNEEPKFDACDEVGKLKGDEKNCQTFYQCTNNGWAPLKCKDGLFFNEDISVCDWPKEGTKCVKDTQTDEQSGDGHESQNDQSKLDACAEVGKLKGDKENCQKFYQCTNNGWAPLSCDFGLYFNEEISVCDWPKAGSKCGKDIHTNDQSGDGQQGQNEKPKFDECSEVGKLKGDEQNCQKFYQCTNNGWVSLKCQDGLFFNEDISVCDWPKEGIKCGKDTHTDNNSGEHGQDDGSNQESCQKVGEFKADEKDCQTFYQCTNIGWEKLRCKDGLFFNTKISVCDWPKAGSKCGSDDGSDDHSRQNDDDHNNDGHNGGNHDTDLDPCTKLGNMKADTKHCDLYYQCTSCGWSLKPCETGLLFNPKTSVCDKAERVTCAREGDLEPCDKVGQVKPSEKHCDTYQKCTKCGWALVKCGSGLKFDLNSKTCTNSEQATCSTNNDDNNSKLEPCNKVGELKADSESCDHYFNCTKKGWGSLPCKSGYLFNSKNLACEIASQVKCGNDNDNDHSGGHDQDQHDHEDHDNEPLEPCEQISALKADPKNCGRYYQCTTYGWQNMPCYNGLLYNSDKSICDYSYNVKCQIN